MELVHAQSLVCRTHVMAALRMHALAGLVDHPVSALFLAQRKVNSAAAMSLSISLPEAMH